MNMIKKQFCLILVLNALVINHVVAMDGSFSSKHQRSHSASSSSSTSPRVIIEDVDSDSPSSKRKDSPSRLDDIDGITPVSPIKKNSSARITLTPAESATSDHFFKDAKLYLTVAPNIQMAGGRGRDATWSESLTNPKYWMPVITGITAGTVQAILQAGANWLTQDAEVLTLERQITLLSYSNKKSMLEATQKALDAKKNIVEIAQAKVEELLLKLNDGQELSDSDQEILQRNLSLIQKLTSIT